jgi:hypothetical protein
VIADSLSHNYIGGYILIEMHWSNWEYAVTQLVEALRLKTEGRGFDSRCWLKIDSVSNRFKYQKYFLKRKGSRCVGLTTLPPSLPQSPGTLGACNSPVPELLAVVFCHTKQVQY